MSYESAAPNACSKELRDKFYRSMSMDQWLAMSFVSVMTEEDKWLLTEALDSETTTLQWDVTIDGQRLRSGSFLAGCGQINMFSGEPAKDALLHIRVPAEIAFFPPAGVQNRKLPRSRVTD